VILLYDVEHAEILAHSGYGVLLYDLRGSGKSEGDIRTFGWLDVDDVAAALTFLQNRDDLDPQRIGMMGFSLGGQIALRAAVQMDEIRAVVADGPSLANYRDTPPPVSLFDWVLRVDNWLILKFLEWRTGTPAPPAVVEVIADIAPRPILLISTGQDIEQRMARYYYEQAGYPKTLWEIPETDHGGGLAARPDEYKERIVLFFDKVLLGDGSSR
jgi:pimeloyl-ACP methyl ester carboxylesterase